MSSRSANAGPIVIVGAGPVGLSIAARLAGHGIEVLVLEAGGDAQDSLNTVSPATTSGQPYPHSINASRARGLGGTSTMWQRRVFRCRPLDRFDFEARADGLRDGWPIGSAAVDRFVDDAHDILGLGPPDYDAAAALHDDEPPIVSNVFETGLFRLGDLGVFRDFVRRTVDHPNITLLDDTEVVAVRQRENGVVDGVEVIAASDNTRSEIDCRAVVLASGGLENARLLLLSVDGEGNSPGNSSGLVGRGFMEHPHTELGHLVPAEDARLGFFDRRDHQNDRTEGYLGLTPEALYEHHLPRVCIWLHPVSLRRSIADVGQAIASAARVRRRRAGSIRSSARVARATLIDAVMHRDERQFQRIVSCELEQFPMSESWVTLSDDRDQFGRPGIHVHWTLGSEFDRLHDRLIDVVGPALEDAGIGELVPFPEGHPGRNFGVGNHHMGTTRMSERAADGVVDTDCAVHGVTGLYVAGTSVFPTSGAANPTLTAVALGLRLADHLAHGSDARFPSGNGSDVPTDFNMQGSTE